MHAFSLSGCCVVRLIVTTWSCSHDTVSVGDSYQCFGEILCLHFQVECYPEDGVSTYLRNVDTHLPDYMLS
jgi:hypothetical protein